MTPSSMSAWRAAGGFMASWSHAGERRTGPHSRIDRPASVLRIVRPARPSSSGGARGWRFPALRFHGPRLCSGVARRLRVEFDAPHHVPISMRPTLLLALAFVALLSTACTRSPAPVDAATSSSPGPAPAEPAAANPPASPAARSEEHTSELQSLMRISYAVFCLKKNKNKYKYHNYNKQTHIITT